jgi:hypothetical protein
LPQAVPTAEGTPIHIGVTDATEAFLAKCLNRGIQPSTLIKYKTFTRQLNAYAESRGLVNLDQFTVSDMDRFYASWSDGIRARAKKLERLKAFIAFCLKRKWITEELFSKKLDRKAA